MKTDIKEGAETVRDERDRDIGWWQCLVEVACWHESMSVCHRTKSIDRFSQHRSIDWRHRTLVLHWRHHVRELVRQRVLAVEVGTIQRHRARRFGHGAALAKILGPNRWFVGPRMIGRSFNSRIELFASHDRELTVDPIMFLTPLR